MTLFTKRSSFGFAFIAACIVAIGNLSAPSAYADASTPRVRIKTSMGVITLELDTQRAPITVKNFLQYARDKHYDGTIIHRVIPGFVIQGGGYTDKNIEKPTRNPVPNESGNGLSNRRGTVGLARTGDPHSGTAQFYINIGDNVALDPQPNRWGYAVFGRVVEGLDVAQKISEVPTGASGPMEDAPIKQVLIEKVEILD
jgi:cyclophilin family peptidyl-prolyl cis-trans isomerase